MPIILVHYSFILRAQHLLTAAAVGVDDDTVDSYGEKLREMELSTCEREKTYPTTKFASLRDIFFGNEVLAQSFMPAWIDSVELPHLLGTDLNPAAEMCRKLLMAMCEIDTQALRNVIKVEQGASLALYRGFSRFMLEDLAVHPKFLGQSKSQRKKLATKVAGEMIKVSRCPVLSKEAKLTQPDQRNQAYSNLMELLFPSHIRLSIHA